MPFIGKQPQVGAYSKLDAITTSATATYNLTLNSGAYYPSSANHLMVSLNGVMQAPQDSFTISGATIIFASTLASTDSIDFIMALGDVLDIGTPSDGTVVTAKIQNAAVTTAKLADDGVTTAKIADANITTGKLASSLDLSGKTVTYGLTDSDMPSGSVLQVVTATDQTQRSTTSTSYVTASNTLTVNITPISTSSKILVLVSTIGGHSTGGGKVAYFTIFRGSTDLGSTGGNGNGLSQNYGGSSDVRTSMNMNILDSPSTTSQITYQVYIKDDGSSGQVDINWNSSKGTITAMEIGG